MNDLPLLDPGPPPPWLTAASSAFHADLFAMYSSLFGGIVTDPAWMMVPVDDHLVHRGDGVFETLKVINGNVFLLEAHLDRLEHSATCIGLKLPVERSRLRDILVQTVRAGRRPEALVRVLLSRGPGSMGISPADCPRPALYVIVHKLLPPFMDLHPEGARVGLSAIPLKAGMFATIKTCNYLPNALMKQEAIDRELDFVVGVDEQGNLAEGPTENLGIVDADHRLVIPRPARILAGTTMNRAFELADELVARNLLTARVQADIPVKSIGQAREILIFGTTANVTAVTRFEGCPVADGKPGPVFHALSQRVLADLHDPASPSLTPVLG